MAQFPFTQIPMETFKNLQLNAGCMLYDFDVSEIPDTDTIQQNLIGATSGGLTIEANPTYSDLGEDIDNCPKNTKELKHLDAWEVKISGTFVSMTADSATFQFAAADYDESTGKITLRNYLDSDADFKDIWWVGDYNNGEGLIAVHIFNALSTGGWTIKSNDQAKGTSDFEFTGHYSIYDQDQVPMEAWVLDAA